MVTLVSAGKYNATTLRAAITAANAHVGADAIKFAVTGTINLSSALPAIKDNLTITGPGASKLTVQRSSSASTNFSVFNLNAGKSATLSGLTIAKGTGTLSAGITDGGGIFNSGALAVVNCALSGNSAGGGGGIYNSGAATLTGVTVSKNSSSNDRLNWSRRRQLRLDPGRPDGVGARK